MTRSQFIKRTLVSLLACPIVLQEVIRPEPKWIENPEWADAPYEFVFLWDVTGVRVDAPEIPIRLNKDKTMMVRKYILG